MPKDELDSFLNRDDSVKENAGGADSNLVLNLDEVDESSTFTPLPAGIYNAVVENTEYGPSKAGNPMITWTLRVVDPSYDGRFLFTHTTLNNDTGKKRLKRTIIRLGLDTDFSKFNPAAFCDNGDAIGLPCRVKVRIRPYQGQKTNDVTDVLAPAEDAGSFLPEE